MNVRPCTAIGAAILLCIFGASSGAHGQSVGAEGYEQARWHEFHFRPAIEKATDDQCIACHEEILAKQPLAQSPSGLATEETLAWYQTLDTYEGPQESFHRRHLVTPLATELMSLRCNFCHLGHDPRDEAPWPPTEESAGYTLRKMVDPAQTCLLCHGRFPDEVMDGVEGSWHEVRADFEDEETLNGCLVCHEDLFRTVRHQVNYLKASAIENAAKNSSDVCLGCHGGRAWYATSYPYPRHPWPDMPEETPDWAKDRPSKSDDRFLAGVE